MRPSPLLLVTGLGVGVTGCSTEPRFCADVLQVLTVALVNDTGQPLSRMSVTDTVRRIGVVLHITDAIPAGPLPVHAIGRVPIFTNAFREELALAGDEVVVVVTADAHTVSGDFRLASDGCFVHQVAGPDTLVVL